MAFSVNQALCNLFFITLFSTFLVNLINGEFAEQSPVVSTERMEKMTQLHFYFHDIIDGESPTAVKIISPDAGYFGETYMADDPLTEGPEPTSKLVGRAQGVYALASKEGAGLLMVMNFAFLEGIYNGSTISVLGRNQIFESVREMPVVGGSGIFRFARGYALAKTFWMSQKGDAVVEYNVSVVHY
ncbi:hypothetical protein SLEP1_g5979 [Rubroshorea leprosula]|uniref:Dirigent protein n=1 Tax=Rubroshorea leprosula TaxID=152421 RepID=A0AAV5HZI8_9ROSI|nr:hypothetical protein SLEP1_g5979 [Rubroshorea leprosula]